MRFVSKSLTAKMCFVKILFPLIDFLWLDLFYQTAFNSSLSHKSALSCFFKAQTNLNLKFIRIQYTASTLDFPWAPLADGLLQDEVFIISVCTSAFKSESMCGERKLLGELWKATQRIQTKYCHSQYSKTFDRSMKKQILATEMQHVHLLQFYPKQFMVHLRSITF